MDDEEDEVSVCVLNNLGVLTIGFVLMPDLLTLKVQDYHGGLEENWIFYYLTTREI